MKKQRRLLLHVRTAKLCCTLCNRSSPILLQTCVTNTWALGQVQHAQLAHAAASCQHFGQLCHCCSSKAAVSCKAQLLQMLAGALLPQPAAALAYECCQVAVIYC